MHKREHNKSERSKYIRFISLYIFCLLVTVMIIIFLHDTFLAFLHYVAFVIVIRLQAPQSIVVVIRSLPCRIGDRGNTYQRKMGKVVTCASERDVWLRNAFSLATSGVVLFANAEDVMPKTEDTAVSTCSRVAFLISAIR